MKKLLMICGVVLAIASIGPGGAQTPAPAPTDYSIKVTPAEIDLIGEALGQMPFQKVAAFIQKLRNQIVEQQQAASKPPEGSK